MMICLCLHGLSKVYRNNESVTPNPRSPLEDYSLHIIDLHSGRLCDTRSFKCDKIILSHNQGLYLYRNILAVLSVQQQTIHVFQVRGGRGAPEFTLKYKTLWSFQGCAATLVGSKYW